MTNPAERRLSKRQRECWDARLMRMSAKEAGRHLDISPHTVAMHWRLARLKLSAPEPRSAEIDARTGHAAGERGESRFEQAPLDVAQVATALALSLMALLSSLWVLACLTVYAFLP